MIEPTGKRRRSALETFDGCPFRYNAIYNQGIEDQGDEAHRGIAFHEVAFRYIARLAEHQTPMDREELGLAFQEGIALSNCPATLVDEVWRLVERWAERFELNLRAYLLAEERVETQRFQWRPDLVYAFPGILETIDWKTYYRGLSEDQARREFQAKFYLAQALKAWPNFPIYRFTFAFVRIGYAVSFDATPDEIQAWEPQIDAILNSLEESERSGDWPAMPGSHCGLCRIACPLVDNPAKLPVRLTTKGEAEAAAGDVLVLEQRMKALKKALGAWCQKDGPLVFRGQQFSHSAIDSVRYPAAGLIDLLREVGRAVADLTVSKTSAGKALDGLKGEALEKAQALAITKRGWRFGHKKAGVFDEEDEETTE